MITQLAIVLVLVAACYGRTEEEVKGWFFSLAVDCNKEFSIPNEELAMLNDHQLPNGQVAKCLMACVYKKADLTDASGNYDSEKTNKWIETEFADDATGFKKAKSIFDHCNKVNDEPVSDGEKGCDRAYLLSKCLIEKYKSME